MSPPLIFEILVQQQQQGGAVATTATSQYASYGVKVDWSGNPTAVGPFTGTYDDLVAEPGHGVKSVRIRRGRDDALSAMQAGEATIVLHDPDGLYNPNNSASALAGSLLPLKAVKITGNNGSSGGIDWSLFYGFIRSIEHDPRLDVQETRIECVGPFILLARSTPSSSPTGAPTTATGYALGSIVGDTGWDFPSTGLTTTVGYLGTLLPDYYEPTGSDGLTEVQNLLAADRGCMFEGADGDFVYESRALRTDKSSTVTVNDTMMALGSGVDLDRVANRARVTRTGGETQEANNATSQAVYGVVDVGDIESPYLADDAAALTLAQYLVDQFGTARPPMYRLDQMNRSTDTMTAILSTELQERITVTDSRGGTSGDYYVEAIEHEITEGGKYHRCSWICSARGTGTATGHAGVIVGGSSAIPPTVTYLESTSFAFPTSPNDRDEVYVVVDGTNGVVWHFRYRAASSSSYKWEFVGGPPLTAAVETDQSTTSTSFTNLTTVGPSITVPFAGDYIVRVSGNTYSSSGTGSNLHSYSKGATAASTAWGADQHANGTNQAQQYAAEDVQTSLAASTALVSKYANSAAATGQWRRRRMSVLPRRVSG